jgi:ABC-type Fe3+/spermidine/putrescine transport system ATPase subunit
MTAIPPHRRNVNTVFQSYALFPFLSVFDNVAFGLRNRHLSKTDLGKRVHEALVIRPERVRIEPYGSAGDNRVPAMVERLVFLGAATQVMLRLGAGLPSQALVQNDGEQDGLAQGSPVHVFLPPDGLRVLGGAAREVPVAPEDDSLVSS